jgi:hypothetical protein
MHRRTAVAILDSREGNNDRCAVYMPRYRYQVRSKTKFYSLFATVMLAIHVTSTSYMTFLKMHF